MEIVVNDEARRVDDGLSIAALLEELDLTGKLVAVEVNRELVSHQERAEHRLAEGDRLEIVTLVGGG